MRRSVLGRVSSPPRFDDCRPLAKRPTLDGAGSQLVGQPFTPFRSRTSGTGNAHRSASMVRITEVDANGHEIETKEEPKTRQLVNLSPADAKAVADHERKADSLIEKDRLHQAHAPLCEAISIRERALGFRHPDLCEPLCKVGGVLRATGRFDDAEKAYRRSLEIREKHDGDALEVARTLEALGEVLRAQGNLTSAEACLREGLEKLESCRGPKDPEIGGSLVNLASLLDQVGRSREALVTIQRAVLIFDNEADERCRIAEAWERHLERKVAEEADSD